MATKCKLTALLFVAVIVLNNCKSVNKRTYAISDFRESLQPYLMKIVTIGAVRSDTTTRYIQQHVSDKELKQLSQSEHPVLRAVAFRSMLQRSSFNHFQLIMNNLDDSAIIVTNEWVGREGGGQIYFGYEFSRVSDDILRHGKWKDSNARNKTINEVILRHNYLQSAYEKLLEMQPREIYYSSIKEMVQYEGRDRRDDESFRLLEFEDIERAFYALAKFGRKEDIGDIKLFLLNNTSRIGELSCRLMQEYPNEEYLEVYERIYPKLFYIRICNDRYDFNGVSFIGSLATYRNERSARILDSILHQQPFLSCVKDTNYRNYIKEELVLAIWNNPCAAYSKMRTQVAALARQYQKDTPQFESVTIRPPNSPEPVSWEYK